MSDWGNFFIGELSAAAALTGLLFVSLSVNQARILQLGRLADRGLEALSMLMLVIVVASLPLVPGQPIRLLGVEILLAGSVALIATLRLQQIYLPALDPLYRRQSARMVAINRLTVAIITLSGVLLVIRGDEAGMYLLPLGILLAFFAAGVSAWVLLIEINR